MNQPPFRSFAEDHVGASEPHLPVLVVAVVLSLGLHLGLGWRFRDASLPFPGAYEGADARQRLALRGESSVRAHLVPPEEDPAEPAPGDEDRPGAAAPEEGDLLVVPQSETPAVLFDPPPIPQEADATVGGLAPPEPAAEVEPVVPWQPREQIVEISSRLADDSAAAIARSRVIPPIERIVGAPDVLPAYTVSAAVEALAQQSAPVYLPPAPSRTDVRQPESVLAAETTAIAAPLPVEADSVAEGQGAAAFLREVPRDVAPAVPIEDVLDASISVHRPRRDDGFVYFQVEVRRKGADVLPPVPRNILLAQDASRSISVERLHHCREAFRNAISSQLLPTDRFNVLAFNTANTFAFPGEWRPATPENIAAATAFVDALHPEGNTDIYNAAKGVLDLPRDPGRATIVLLLSDGVATAGDVRRDSEIIGEFSKLNGGSLSVFDVGVSKRSDEYLLSMLSFCNRGGPAAVATDRFRIPEVFSQVLSSVGSPVLTDLRFLFDSSSGAVVTPRMTENLYLDRPLRLYGRAPVGTRDVTFQARGRNGGKKYDMVFSLRLGDPAKGDGNAEIATAWARTRIYDLIAAYVRSADQGALAEMVALGRAHDIPIPFAKNLWK